MPKRKPVETAPYSAWNFPDTFWLKFPSIEFGFVVTFRPQDKTLTQKTERVRSVAKTLIFYCANPSLPEALEHLSAVVGLESAQALLAALEGIDMSNARGWLVDEKGYTWAEVLSKNLTPDFQPNIKHSNIDRLVKQAAQP